MRSIRFAVAAFFLYVCFLAMTDVDGVIGNRPPTDAETQIAGMLATAAALLGYRPHRPGSTFFDEASIRRTIDGQVAKAIAEHSVGYVKSVDRHFELWRDASTEKLEAAIASATPKHQHEYEVISRSVSIEEIPSDSGVDFSSYEYDDAAEEVEARRNDAEARMSQGKPYTYFSLRCKTCGEMQSFGVRGRHEAVDPKTLL